MNTNDPNFGPVEQGSLVRAFAGNRGIYIGCTPAGVSVVRWIRPGELRNAKKVRDDVNTLINRFSLRYKPASA